MYSELGAVIVAGSCIEININLALTDGINKLVLVELREFQNVVIEEVVLPFAVFDFKLLVGLNVETVCEFHASLME